MQTLPETPAGSEMKSPQVEMGENEEAENLASDAAFVDFAEEQVRAC